MGNTDTSDKNTSELEIKQNQSLQPAEVEMMDIKSNSQQQQLLLTGTTPAAAPREALIHTAITFLLNPNVKRSPLNQKQKFLRSKGLTDDEIQIACERAGVFSIDPNSSIINIPNNNNNNNNTGGILQSGSSLSSNNMVYSPPVKTKQTTLQKIKDILTSTALIAGITYAIYLFYKVFPKYSIISLIKKKERK